MVGAIVITIKQKIKDSFFFVFAIPGPVSALYINDIYPLIVYSILNPASRIPLLKGICVCLPPGSPSPPSFHPLMY